MSDITEEDVMKYCCSRNLMLVTKESLEYMHRPIAIETMNKNAIPIEWINDWYWNNPDVCCDKHVAIWFAKLLNDWRKENER